MLIVSILSTEADARIHRSEAMHSPGALRWLDHFDAQGVYRDSAPPTRIRWLFEKLLGESRRFGRTVSAAARAGFVHTARALSVPPPSWQRDPEFPAARCRRCKNTLVMLDMPVVVALVQR